ncbi:hypothetical protein NPIL_137431 [Nephila pilipes]|uniref:Uncharacterized protein n=1 Tax=Nephila pilipes TaxID=299642 RepID=A0A8X6U269_NEPPI|nr:hypothetical protein NPIL_137431 [Nephila pilipes]
MGLALLRGWQHARWTAYAVLTRAGARSCHAHIAGSTYGSSGCSFHLTAADGGRCTCRSAGLVTMATPAVSAGSSRYAYKPLPSSCLPLPPPYHARNITYHIADLLYSCCCRVYVLSSSRYTTYIPLTSPAGAQFCRLVTIALLLVVDVAVLMCTPVWRYDAYCAAQRGSSCSFDTTAFSSGLVRCITLRWLVAASAIYYCFSCPASLYSSVYAILYYMRCWRYNGAGTYALIHGTLSLARAAGFYLPVSPASVAI